MPDYRDATLNDLALIRVCEDCGALVAPTGTIRHSESHRRRIADPGTSCELLDAERRLGDEGYTE